MRVFIMCFWLLSLLTWQTTYSQTQSKTQLLAEKKAKKAKLAEVSKILNQTSKAHHTSVGQLNALLAQINARQEIVKTAQKELAMITEDIEETNIIIGALEKDLDALKKEYAEMIFEASKLSSSYNRLSFLFSSNSFNDAYRRIAYLRHYTKARKVQVEQIKKTQIELSKQNKKILSQRKIKSDAISSFNKEKEELAELIKEKNKLVKKLSSKVSQLRVEYNKEKVALIRLEKSISTVIKKEVAKTTTNSPVSKSFKASRRKLIWPVSSGFVTKKFGRHKHPIHKILENNIGITIQTSKGASVKAVFAGKVLQVVERPGFGYTIIVNHGNYYTVYNNLKHASVKKGQQVKRGTPIGVVMTSRKGISELLFCISYNNKFQDPLAWLVPK